MEVLAKTVSDKVDGKIQTNGSTTNGSNGNHLNGSSTTNGAKTNGVSHTNGHSSNGVKNGSNHFKVVDKWFCFELDCQKSLTFFSWNFCNFLVLILVSWY